MLWWILTSQIWLAIFRRKWVVSTPVFYQFLAALICFRIRWSFRPLSFSKYVALSSTNWNTCSLRTRHPFLISWPRANYFHVFRSVRLRRCMDGGTYSAHFWRILVYFFSYFRGHAATVGVRKTLIDINRVSQIRFVEFWKSQALASSCRHGILALLSFAFEHGVFWVEWDAGGSGLALLWYAVLLAHQTALGPHGHMLVVAVFGRRVALLPARVHLQSIFLSNVPKIIWRWPSKIGRRNRARLIRTIKPLILIIKKSSPLILAVPKRIVVAIWKVRSVLRLLVRLVLVGIYRVILGRKLLLISWLILHVAADAVLHLRLPERVVLLRLRIVRHLIILVLRAKLLILQRLDAGLKVDFWFEEFSGADFRLLPLVTVLLSVVLVLPRAIEVILGATHTMVAHAGRNHPRLLLLHSLRSRMYLAARDRLRRQIVGLHLLRTHPIAIVMIMVHLICIIYFHNWCYWKGLNLMISNTNK